MSRMENNRGTHRFSLFGSRGGEYEHEYEYRQEHEQGQGHRHRHEQGQGDERGGAARGRGMVRRRGMALLVVVVLVMLVSLAAYRYSFEMENEYRMTRLQEEQVQARLCAQSGIEFAASLLEQPLQVRQAVLQGEEPSRVFSRVVEQSNLVERSLNADRQESQWRFAILSNSDIAASSLGTGTAAAPASGSDPLGKLAAWKWGLESESAKLHIPTLLKWNQMRPGLARSVLLTLPEADEETVESWLASLGLQTASTAAQDAMQTAMGGGMQSNLQRQQRTKSLERFKLRWLGGDLDQNYRLDPWEEALMERLLSDPLTGEAPSSPMARELSKLNSTAMGQGTGQDGVSQGPGAWNRYLTWVQGERNERPTGKRRIWLNQPDLRRLHQELSEVMTQSDANYIVALRQYGPGAMPTVQAPSGNGARPTVRRGVAGMDSGGASAGPSQSSRAGANPGGSPNAGSGNASSPQTAGWTPNWQIPPKYALKSPIELVDSTLSIEAVPAGPPSSSSNEPSGSASRRPTRQTLTSPWNGNSSDVKVRLARLLATTTTVDQPVIEGRIDIATAPAIVLGAVPGMTPEIAQRIVQARQENSTSTESIASVVWLVEKGIVDWVKLGELEPYLTTRSDVFSLQSVGFRDDRTPVFRSTVMIDARQIPAQVRDMRVWHPWDRGFSTDALTQSVP